MSKEIYQNLIQGNHTRAKEMLDDQRNSLGECDLYALSALLNANTNNIEAARDNLKIVASSTCDPLPKSIALEAELQISLKERIATLEDVKDQINGILKINPDSVFALDALAQIEFGDGKIDSGIEKLERIHSELPKTNWINKRLAQYLILNRQIGETPKYIAQMDDPISRYVYSFYTRIYHPYKWILWIPVVVLFVLRGTYIYTYLLLSFLILTVYLYLRIKRDPVFPGFFRNLFVIITVMFGVILIGTLLGF